MTSVEISESDLSKAARSALAREVAKIEDLDRRVRSLEAVKQGKMRETTSLTTGSPDPASPKPADPPASPREPKERVIEVVIEGSDGRLYFPDGHAEPGPKPTTANSVATREPPRRWEDAIKNAEIQHRVREHLTTLKQGPTLHAHRDPNPKEEEIVTPKEMEEVAQRAARIVSPHLDHLHRQVTKIEAMSREGRDLALQVRDELLAEPEPEAPANSSGIAPAPTTPAPETAKDEILGVLGVCTVCQMGFTAEDFGDGVSNYCPEGHVPTKITWDRNPGNNEATLLCHKCHAGFAIAPAEPFPGKCPACGGSEKELEVALPVPVATAKASARSPPSSTHTLVCCKNPSCKDAVFTYSRIESVPDRCPDCGGSNLIITPLSDDEVKRFFPTPAAKA